MASSGSISGAYRGYTVQSNWSATKNVEGNYSTVNVDHYLICGRSWDLYIGNRTNTCTCGETKNFDSAAISTGGNSTIYLGSTSHRVNHDADGNKTVTMTTVFYLKGTISGTYVDSITASGTITLDRIPRSSKIKSDTTNWKTTNRLDSGFKIGIEKYSNSFYHKLVVQYRTSSTQAYTNLKTVNNVEDGSEVTFTSSELNTMYTASVPDTTETIRLVLYTYSDSGLTTQIGDASTFDLTGALTIVAPTFSNFTYVDTNGTTTNLTKDSGTTIIKGYSTLKITISTANKATANTRQTSMSHYIADGVTIPYSSSAEVTKSFTNYSKDNISVYAVDARGTASQSVNKSFSSLGKYIDYTVVTKNDNQSYSRSDSGVGEFVTLTFSGSWWGNRKFSTNSSAVTNSLSATYKYRVSGASQWVTPSNPNLTLTLSKAQSSDTYYTRYSFNDIVYGDLSSHGFDVSKSYDIMVTVSDELSSVSYNFAVHSGEPALALYGNKAALGAKYNESLGGTQLWGDIYINGDAFEYINPIIETDTNSDGTYIVFYDGTLICYKTVTANVEMTTAWGSMYEGRMSLGNWAASFIGVPHVQVTNVSATGAMIESYEIPPTSSSAGEIFLARPNSYTHNVSVNVIGIGRWK